MVSVDGGYTHEFTTAQVHYFLEQEYGADYAVKNPGKFAVFEDHLIYADEVPKMRAFLDKIETLRELQREFQRHTGVRDFSARDRHLARHLPRGGPRAASSSPATSSRRPTATPAWAGSTTRSPGASGRPSTPPWSTRASPRSRSRSRSASS